jgi:hypothetical protein
LLSRSVDASGTRAVLNRDLLSRNGTLVPFSQEVASIVPRGAAGNSF